jgi:hypothetical protein
MSSFRYAAKQDASALKNVKLFLCEPFNRSKENKLSTGGRTACSAPYSSANTITYLFFLKFLVLFAKALNAPGRIHQLLFAGKKRVAFGANFNMDVAFGRTDLHNVSAGTRNGRLRIAWMNVRFHFNFNPLHILCIHGF